MTLNICQELCWEENVTWLPQPEVSETPWLFTENKCKISLTNWINMYNCIICPDIGLNVPLTAIPLTHLFIYAFSKSRAEKGLIFLKTQYQLVFQFHKQWSTIFYQFNTIHVRKMYKCTLEISLIPDFFKDFNFPWLEVKFPEFSLTLKNIFFPFPDLWQPCQLYTANLYLNKKLLMLLMLAYTVQTQHVTHSIVIHFLFGDICKYARKLSWR